MSISYCSVICKEENIMIAESTKCTSHWNKIKKLLDKINKGIFTNSFEIENDLMLSYVRTKTLIFIVISTSRINEDKINRIMTQLIEKLKNDFGGLDRIIENKHIFKLCMQDDISPKLDKIISDFDSKVNNNKEIFKDMQLDVDGIRMSLNKNIREMLKDNEDLQEMLIKSNSLEANANIYKAESREVKNATKCFKPWMAYSLIFVLICSILYLVFALTKWQHLS